MIKALETTYNGFRFRSRLEARWAVFMDAIGVRYEYEREAYDLDGLYYLPDFWVPHIEAHIEIKPERPNEEEFEKATRLAKHTQRNVYILFEAPDNPSPDVGDASESAIFLDSRFEGGCDYSHWWCECRRCHRIELQFTGFADRIGCECPKGGRYFNSDSPRLLSAYAKAKSYRFEPGAVNQP